MENEPPSPVPAPPRTAVLVLYAAFVIATLGGILVASSNGGPWHGSVWAVWAVVIASFVAVITSSLLLSWSAEAAQFLISQGFIVATIALVQVLPEFMIEAVFAWRLDKPNMLANLTGSNRLLMGLGWPLIYVTCAVAHWLDKKKLHGPIQLEPGHAIEVWALIVSSGYFLVILWRGAFVILDGVILFGLFVSYLLILFFMPEEEEGKEDLLAPSLVLVELPRQLAVAAIGGILTLGSATMILVANPFVDSMKNVAASFGIREFYFVQWVAPFLTEFPEKVTAFYWAKRVKTAPIALLNMVSSKVNQWTLLASMIPVVYAFSLWRHGLPIEGVVIEEKLAPELWLSLAMTMYGAACLLKRRFTGANCLILFTLWFVQFVSPEGHGFSVYFDMRKLTAIVFGILTPIELVMNARRMTPLGDLREIGRLLRQQREKTAKAPSSQDG